MWHIMQQLCISLFQDFLRGHMHVTYYATTVHFPFPGFPKRTHTRDILHQAAATQSAKTVSNFVELYLIYSRSCVALLQFSRPGFLFTRTNRSLLSQNYIIAAVHFPFPGFPKRTHACDIVWTSKHTIPFPRIPWKGTNMWQCLDNKCTFPFTRIS